MTLFLGWVLGLVTIRLANYHYNSSIAISENRSLTYVIHLSDEIGRQEL